MLFRGDRARVIEEEREREREKGPLYTRAHDPPEGNCRQSCGVGSVHLVDWPRDTTASGSEHRVCKCMSVYVPALV